MKINSAGFMAVSLILLAACTYTLRSQQFSINIQIATAERASVLRETVRHFARSHGFQKEIKPGNEVVSEGNGNFALSFIAADESYISLNNVLKKNCYSLGIYSAQGELVAGRLGVILIQSLKEHGIILDGKAPISECKS